MFSIIAVLPSADDAAWPARSDFPFRGHLCAPRADPVDRPGRSRSHFLLYERVDVVVSLTNIGNSDLQLNNDEGQPWLSFLVMGEHEQHTFLPVHSERQSNFAPLTLKMNETKTLRVNITPLFTMRAEGNYRVSAVVDLPGAGQIVTDAVAVHHRARACPCSTRCGWWTRWNAITRSSAFRPTRRTRAFICASNRPSENTVYSNYALGPLVVSIDPTMFFDPQGNVHVLQPMSQGTYLYTRTDPDGKLLAQRLFKSTMADDGSGMRVRPLLVKSDDGNVYVSGGLQQDPERAAREAFRHADTARKIMAPTSTDQQLQHGPHRSGHGPGARLGAPRSAPVSDSAPPLVGDPGAAAKAASPNSPSSTDMPPAGP